MANQAAKICRRQAEEYLRNSGILRPVNTLYTPGKQNEIKRHDQKKGLSFEDKYK